MTTNADIESEIARKTAELLRKLEMLPAGYQCEVHLHRGNRKKRRDAEFRWNWDPDTDSIRISFTPMEVEEETDDAEVGTSEPSAISDLESIENRLSDLVRALERAEGRPGYEFVSLKWFRDTALTHEGFSWVTDEFARHDVLREAIDRRWILTSKIANPRPPHFPVTAIRLNRQVPEINSALGHRPSGRPAFRPVAIRGEPLSDTVLRDRR